MSENNRTYYSILTLPELDQATEKEARSLFLGYKAENIICTGSFEDDTWYLSNEVEHVGFHFGIKDEDYKIFGEKLHMDKRQFITYVKTYAIFRMGELALRTIEEIIYGIRRLIKNKKSDINYQYSPQFFGRISEFFSLLPRDRRSEAIDRIIDGIDLADDVYMTEEAGPRKLAVFESYFLFQDILDKFWKQASEEERLFFFPVYLWWHVSGVIPMRPRELVLTERGCISGKPGERALRVRKNKIKGSGRNHNYKIAKDYATATFQIPDDLADEILWYIRKTDDFPDNDLQTLLCVVPHYAKWNRSKPRNSRYYTYANLATCLRYFFEEVIRKEFGYTILFDRDRSRLEEGEIQYLHLGDTRHLSMINLIAEGATPTVVATLASHESVCMSAHYFRNIEQLIECNVYRKYKRLKSGDKSYSIETTERTALPDEIYTRIGNGRCYSAGVIRGDFSDCRKVIGRNGELGNCKTCSYYRAEDRRFRGSKELYTSRIEAECKELATIINKARKLNGNTEDIVQAVLRLKSAEHSYQQYLEETMNLEE